MKIWVYAICKNEEKFAARWIESMREADGISVLDTGSEDESVEILRKLGAKVRQERIVPWRFDTARNRALALVPEDVDLCVCTDLDEVFHPGWRLALEQAYAPEFNQYRYRYTWNFLPDGREGHVFYAEKIHCRYGFSWVGPVHEVLQCDAPAIRTVPGIQLDHHADPEKSRGQYLPLLELAVREDPLNDRNCHYLGREYMFYARWEDAIRMLQRHLALPTAQWTDERCASMRFLARCYRQLGNINSARQWLLRAAAEAPWLREPWLELAELLVAEENWDGVVYATEQACQIAARPETYISEATAWGSLPWDLLSLGFYYTGRYQRALEAVEQALVFAPEDARLRENLRLIQNRISAENDRLSQKTCSGQNLSV